MSPVRVHPAPVLVVGTGPVGLFQAHALATLGVPVIIVGRHLSRLGAPKAHALSPRSLEICRQFDISVAEIRQHPAPRHEARWVRFVTNLSGQEVGCLPYERMSLDVLDASPEMLHNIAQPDFEAMVMRLIEKNSNVDLRQGWTWISSEEVGKGNDAHVSTVLKNTYTGEETTVRSSLVIGCDGANSRVRQSLGITAEAEDGTETMMTIHFSADLRPVVKDRVGMLHWIMDPMARGFIIAYDLGGNQVLIHNFDPQYHSLESFTEEKCRAIVGAAIGQDVPVKFHSSMPWLLRRQVADEYFRGRVVLAGDSAHSFPPTGGLGLNSGIADAHNLAYKISAVYHGWADLPTVLRSYQIERRPVAVRNSMQSVRNGRKIFALLKALKNTDPDVDVARREMSLALKDPQQFALIQELIKEQVEHFDNLMLHIGYVYEPGWNPKNATDFTPAYRTGARLPHAWIKPRAGSLAHLPEVDLAFLHDDLEPTKIARWKYSTLDLVAADSFTLLFDQSSQWAGKVDGVLADLNRSRIHARAVQHGRDFDIVEEQQRHGWLDGFDLLGGNLVVVRPDQHIAFLAGPGESADDVAQQIRETLGTA